MPVPMAAPAVSLSSACLFAVTPPPCERHLQPKRALPQTRRCLAQAPDGRADDGRSESNEGESGDAVDVTVGDWGLRDDAATEGSASGIDSMEIRQLAGGQYVEDSPVTRGGDQDRLGRHRVAWPGAVAWRSAIAVAANTSNTAILDGVVRRIATSAGPPGLADWPRRRRGRVR